MYTKALRLLLVILAVTMLIGLVACQQAATPAPEQAAPVQEEAAEEEDDLDLDELEDEEE